jgi:hypothetical protein
MEDFPRSPRCRCREPEDRPTGKLVGNFPDDEVYDIIYPLLLNSQRENKSRINLMLKLRLLNKAWKIIVNNNKPWFHHISRRRGFRFEMLSWGDKVSPPFNPLLMKRCPVHPLITLQDVINESQNTIKQVLKLERRSKRRKKQ